MKIQLSKVIFTAVLFAWFVAFAQPVAADLAPLDDVVWQRAREMQRFLPTVLVFCFVVLAFFQLRRYCKRNDRRKEEKRREKTEEENE